MVAEVLLRLLPVLAVPLPDTGLGVDAGIVLCRLVGAILAWLVELLYL